MLYSTGLDRIIKNISIVSSLHSRTGLTNLSELKAGYIAYLNAEIRKSERSSSNSKIIFNSSEVSDLLSTYLESEDFEEVSFMMNSPEFLKVEHDTASKMKKYFDAFASLDNGLGVLSNILIQSFFLTSDPRSSSASNFHDLGIVWVSPKPSWRIQDYWEVFIHEMTHQAIFLDEICHRHYNDKNQLNKNKVKSAIRGIDRPVEAVVHSAIVGTEIACFRKEYNLPQVSVVHKSTREIVDNSLETIDALLETHENLNIFTEPLSLHLKSCVNKLKGV